MNQQPLEFRELLHRAREGDRQALDLLVKEYESELAKVVKVRLGNSLRPYFDSVDLVQSVHKSVLIGLRDDKLNIQSSEHLVRLAAMIVRRKIARHWKRHRRQLRFDNDHTDSCDGQSLASLILINSKIARDPSEEVELNERLERVLNRLLPLERSLIELRLSGCTTAEAARKLKQDPDVLRARLGRVRRKLDAAGITSEWF